MEGESPVCVGVVETIERVAERIGPNRKSTAERLVQCCLLDLLPNDYEVACDFFRGIAQFSADGRREYLERVRLVFAMYRGLVKLFGVRAEELDRARVRGELMGLIHDKYNKILTHRVRSPILYQILF